MRKITTYFTLIAVALLCAVSCEKYQVVEENSSFAIECAVSDGTVNDGAEMTLSLQRGVIPGASVLSLSLKEEGSGATPEYRLFLNGRTAVSSTDAWSFDESGKAHFTIAGLPAGVYHVSATVKRWYHSATAEASFVIQ